MANADAEEESAIALDLRVGNVRVIMDDVGFVYELITLPGLISDQCFFYDAM